MKAVSKAESSISAALLVDPAVLSPGQRLGEVAQILAAGYLRYLVHRAQDNATGGHTARPVAQGGVKFEIRLDFVGT